MGLAGILGFSRIFKEAGGISGAEADGKRERAALADIPLSVNEVRYRISTIASVSQLLACFCRFFPERYQLYRTPARPPPGRGGQQGTEEKFKEPGVK
jgi:hypothetical protein